MAINNRVVLACISLALLSVPSLSLAEPRGSSKAAARAEARQAARLFDEGKYREAIESFEKAYAIRPHFLVQCNIARCYELLGEPRPAAEHYRRCLDEGGDKSPQADQVREALRAAEKKAAAAETPAPAPAAAPPPPPPPPLPPPPPPPARPFWVVGGVGAGMEIKELSSQLKLRVAGGYHFQRGLTGPNLGFDLSVGVAGGFTSLEAGPLFAWDIALAPAYGLYVAPTVGLGFAYFTAPCTGHGCDARAGMDVQLGAELKLIIDNRALLVFRPVGLDVLATNNGSWLSSVRYDLLLAGGFIF